MHMAYTEGGGEFKRQLNFNEVVIYIKPMTLFIIVHWVYLNVAFKMLL